MRAIIVAAALGAAAAPSSSLAATAPKPVWIAEWAGDRCALLHETTGPTPLTVALQRLGSGRATLHVIDPAWRWSSMRRLRQAELVLQPSGKAYSGMEFVRLQRGYALELHSEEKTFIDELAQSSSITVRRGSTPLLEVQLPGAAKAVAALNQCHESLLRAWGIDPEAQAALSARPEMTTRLDHLILLDTYPRDALHAGHSGSVTVRLDLGADGAVRGCTVVASSGHASLDEATCSVYASRARFTPARDGSGLPTAAPLIARIRWVHPQAPQKPASEGGEPRESSER